MASLKPLIMRANRHLGANLVEQGLVSIDDLDEANERLLELMSSQPNACQVSLLSILVNEKQVLSEDDLLEKAVEDHSLGLIDVRNVDIPEELGGVMQSQECWATLTIPFDQVDDTWFLATAYYFSPAVRDYWKKKIGGNVVWYVASIESISDFLEKFETAAAREAAASK